MFNMEGGDINPLHLDIRVYILHTVLYMHPKVLKKRNLCNNQEHLLLFVISSIIMTTMCDTGVIL